MRGGGWNSGEARAWVGREEWTEEKVRGGAMAAHTHLPLSLPPRARDSVWGPVFDATFTIFVASLVNRLGSG